MRISIKTFSGEKITLDDVEFVIAEVDQEPIMLINQPLPSLDRAWCMDSSKKNFKEILNKIRESHGI